MSTESLHIVHKLIVEVETNSREKGYDLRDNAAGFISGQLSPALEELFLELEKKLGGNVLVLDKLSVNIPAKTTDLTHGDIERLICTAIRKEIDETFTSVELDAGYFEPKQETEQLLSVQKRQLQSVFHFLKTGTRPWWIPDNASLRQLMETPKLLELARTDTETLVQELRTEESGNFTKRMLFQLPESVLIEWIAQAFHFPGKPPVKLPAALPLHLQTRAVKEKWLLQLLQVFREYALYGTVSANELKRLFILTVDPGQTAPSAKQVEETTKLLSIILGEKTLSAISSKELKTLLTEESAEKQAAIKPEEEAQHTKKTDKNPTEDFHTPVENAGLILLHPFLKPFFIETGLMENNQFTNPELAAHVLHFLATGNEKAWEFELQFEKFLCGIPPDEPLEQELLIPEAMKTEAENLLNAVLEHWEALRSDSTDLIRYEFLQREAKIIEEEFQTTRLVFERKAQDILLDKLPWNLGIVKVDWKKDLLFVEW